MFTITKKAVVDPAKCNGCATCTNVCMPVAIRMENKKSLVDSEKCVGCTNCFTRCPQYAITMQVLENPIEVSINPSKFDQDKIMEICLKAHYAPNMPVCVCNHTTAGEIAAAILEGASTPGEIMLKTGAGAGCKIACHEPVLRLLVATGNELPLPKGYQYHAPTKTLWDLSPEILEKHDNKYFLKQDKKFMDDLIEAMSKEEE